MKTVFKLSEGVPPATGKPKQLKSGTVKRLIHPETGTAQHYGISILTMNPGDEVAPHYHKTWEETYFILRGTGVATHKEKGSEKEEEIILEKDMSIYIQPNVIHDIKVTGSDPLCILVTIGPPIPGDVYLP